MTIRAVAWAFGLTGVSPTAKLIAIRLADVPPDDQTGLVVTPVVILRRWVGCAPDAIYPALRELASHGLSVLKFEDGGELICGLPSEAEQAHSAS